MSAGTGRKTGCCAKLQNEKGFALIFTLLLIVVLLTLGSVFVLRAVNEWNLANRDRRVTQAFYIAEGAAHLAIDKLDLLINTKMLETINHQHPQVVINVTQNYVSLGNGLGFLLVTVLDGGVPQFISAEGGNVIKHSVGPLAYGGGMYRFDIVIREKSNPVAVGPDQWDFPFYYRIEGTGTHSGVNQRLDFNGDFTVRVQRDNFAKYALFTNEQSLPNGTNIWFTNKTNFAGPIHTNAEYNFALNPSGTFDGEVTQHEQQARFYNSGWPVLMDADQNGTRDVPVFNSTFERGVDEIVLSSSVQKQDMIDQATGGSSIAGNGIYIPNNGTNLTGGIYVQGNASVRMSVDANNHAVYTLSQNGVTKVVTVNKTAAQTTVETVGVGSVTYSGIPDGVNDIGTIIFVDGAVSSLAGTVQADTELTVASSDDVNIVDNVVYSQYTPAQGNPGDADYVAPNANGADNLLGIVSWDGDVRIAPTAPNNINVHGTILAQNGIFHVDNYNDQSVGPRGTATLLGGVITDNYGAFGLFNGTNGSQLAGYGRNFVYDERMRVGKAPPYFPTLNTFIAFTNDIIDKITIQQRKAE